MPFKSSHMYAGVTPRKARPVADLVRGMNAGHAIDVLTLNPRRASSMLRKVIQSALANASQVQGTNLNQLVIAEIYVNEGPLEKRGRPVARGRFHRIMHKASHLHVVLDEPPAAEPAPKSKRSKAGDDGKKQESAPAGGRI